MCLFVKLKGRKVFSGIGKRNTLLIMITGAIIGINWMLLFESYNYTTVATATLCYYMEPTIVILLSPIIFKERLSLRKALCALAALVGMVFVSGVAARGGLDTENIKGVIYGLLAAALYASVVIINKKIDVDDAYEKTIIQLACAAIILIPYVLFTEKFREIEITPGLIVLVLIVGIVHTGIPYGMYFASFKKLPAQSIAILSYIDPVFALILSSIVLKEDMDVFGIIGAALIICSSIISELKTNRKEASA